MWYLFTGSGYNWKFGWVRVGWLQIFEWDMSWGVLDHSADGLGRVMNNGPMDNSNRLSSNTAIKFNYHDSAYFVSNILLINIFYAQNSWFVCYQAKSHLICDVDMHLLIIRAVNSHPLKLHPVILSAWLTVSRWTVIRWMVIKSTCFYCLRYFLTWSLFSFHKSKCASFLQVIFSQNTSASHKKYSTVRHPTSATVACGGFSAI